MYTHYHTRSTLVTVAALAFTLGIAVGMGIAVFMALRTLQMNMIYPAMIGWGWA